MTKLFVVAAILISFQFSVESSKHVRSSRWHKNALRTGIWKLPPTSVREILHSRALVPDINRCQNEEADNSPKECRNRNCFYCCSDKLCYIGKEYALDCFDRKNYCDSLCDDEYLCRLYGCAYDHEFNQCFGRKGKGVTGFNYCGETVIANGIEFQGVAFRNYDCLPRNLVKSNCVGTPEEQRLFENEVYTFPQLDFEYDIPEDAEYQIVLYFCDARADLRRMDVSLNDNFVKLIEFKQQQATPPVSEAFISTIDFTVQNGVTSLTIASINVLDAPISNGKIKISLRTKFGPGRATPVLSAAYIMKLT